MENSMASAEDVSRKKKHNTQTFPASVSASSSSFTFDVNVCMHVCNAQFYKIKQLSIEKLKYISVYGMIMTLNISISFVLI